MAEAPRPGDAPTSIIIGGPLYRTMVRLGLWGMPRRIPVFLAITWLPLCVLASLGGWRELSEFLRDLPAQVRLLLALPALVLAERVIGPRVAQVTAYFPHSGLLTEADQVEYQKALARLESSCNSALAEGILVLAAFGAGYFWFRREAASQMVGWVSTMGPQGLRLSAAGWWYSLASIPIYHFLAYRWAWRSILWFSFLWRVARLDLRLLPTHPDLAGGLGFLAVGQAAFGAIVFPISAVIASIEGEKMLLGLESFHSVRLALLGIVVVLALFPMIPLFFFTGRLFQTKRQGQFDYGLLGQRYTHLFDQRWVQQKGQDRELLGTSDIQSLADIQNGFGTLMRMRPAPIDRTSALALLVAAAAPMLPLALTEVPLSEIVKRLVGIVL